MAISFKGAHFPPEVILRHWFRCVQLSLSFYIYAAF